MIKHRGRLLGEIDKVKKRQARREAEIHAAIAALDKRKKSLERRLEVIRSRTPLLIEGMERASGSRGAHAGTNTAR